MAQRWTLITGGSGGLGIPVTRAFVERGDTVVAPVVDDTHAERMHAALKDLVADAPDRLVTPVADMANEADVARAVEAMPRVDAAALLVGGFAMGDTAEFAIADLRTQLELNVVTAFTVIKHVLPVMRREGYGRLVTVGSRAAAQPTAGMAAYAAAKAGVLALTQAVADETRGTDITANCVLPSIIDTPANRKAMGDADADRWAKPERLAQTILHLCSAAAGDIRGAAVPTYGSV